MGCSEGNTTGTRFTLRDRGSLSERDCRKLGPSGESNAQLIESLPLGALGGVLQCGLQSLSIRGAVNVSMGLDVGSIPNALQSILGRGVTLFTLARPMA